MPGTRSGHSDFDPMRLPSFFCALDVRHMTQMGTRWNIATNGGGPDTTDWVDTDLDGRADGWGNAGNNGNSIATGKRHTIYQNVAATGLSIYAGTTISQGAPLTAGRKYVITAVFDGANSKAWSNFDLRCSGNAGANPLGGITLGTYYGLTLSFYDGQFNAAYLFSSALTDAERIGVTKWCCDQFGVEV